MASRTQLRLDQITGSLGDFEGGIIDTRSASGAGSIDAITLNSGSLVGVFSEIVSSLTRIHGGDTFAGNDISTLKDIDGNTRIAYTADNGIVFNQEDGSAAALTIGSSTGTDKTVVFGDNASLQSDAAVLNFGADDDVNLTHVADTGLLLNSSRQLQFGDADTYVAQASDGVLQLRSDTTIKTVIGATDTLTINSSGATFGQNVTITGNLDVNGTTTTIDTANLTVEDSIIGLGVSGSDSSFSNVGDRGIVFAKGAAASSLLPAFYYSGDDDIFQLGKTATSAASSSFADPTAGNHSDLRLGVAQFTSADDNIGVKQNGVLEITGSSGLNIFGDAGILEIRNSGANDIVFKNGTNTLLTLDNSYGHSLTGELRISGQNGSTPGALVLKDADDSNTVTIKAAGNVTSNYELILPAAIGTGTQVLRLNSGATALEFADVSAAGNTKKQVLLIGATISKGSVVNTNTGTANVFYAGDAINDLDTEGSQGKVLDVFVNGQLLVSGSNTQVVTDGTRDYEVASTNELKFAFDLEADDIVQAVKRG